MCIDCVSEKSSRDRVGYFKILVFPFHDVGSLAICTNAINPNRVSFGSSNLKYAGYAHMHKCTCAIKFLLIKSDICANNIDPDEMAMTSHLI